MYEGDGFSAKTLGKSLSHFKVTGRADWLLELTGQTIPVIRRISLLISKLSDGQIPNSMHEGNSVSTKTLGKKRFSKTTGPADQFGHLESALSEIGLLLKQQLSTCSTVFGTFLCLHCTTTT